jgi:hypothetical protein
LRIVDDGTGVDKLKTARNPQGMESCDGLAALAEVALLQARNSIS